MKTLLELPNVGKVLASHLQKVGIETPEELRSLGSREAFQRIRRHVDAGACLHMLYGIEGAVRGIPDSRLSAEVKAELKAFLRELR